MMEFICGFVFGIGITLVVNEGWVAYRYNQHCEYQKKLFELEQRIWKNVKEKLDREKEIRK